MILARAAIVLAASLTLLQTAPSPGRSWPVSFVDVAERAGLRATSVYGGIDRKRFIIETNGAGVAFIDYDNDGWVDALVLSGLRLQAGTRENENYAPGSAPMSHLYRNNRDGTFSDVTERSGLRLVGWASSVCAGDYDNDGWIDLAVTNYGENVLYRNRGDGTSRTSRAAPGCRPARHAGDRAAPFSITTATAAPISSSRTTCASISPRRRKWARGRTASGRASP